jgi:hypothetical protein
MAKMNWWRVGKEGRDVQATSEGHPKKARGKMTKSQEKKFRRKLEVNAAKAKRREQNSK